MPKLLTIPFNKEVFEELGDVVIDEKITVDDYIIRLINDECAKTKISKINKIINGKLIKDGKLVVSEIKLNGIELKELQFDPKWFPNNLDKKDIEYREYQVSDKIIEYVKLSASFVHLRHKKYYESLMASNEEIIKNMKFSNASVEQINQSIKNSNQNLENVKKQYPVCVEHAICAILDGIIQQKITENIYKEFAKESEPNKKESPKDNPSK